MSPADELLHDKYASIAIAIGRKYRLPANEMQFIAYALVFGDHFFGPKSDGDLRQRAVRGAKALNARRNH